MFQNPENDQFPVQSLISLREQNKIETTENVNIKLLLNCREAITITITQNELLLLKNIATPHPQLRASFPLFSGGAAHR